MGILVETGAMFPHAQFHFTVLVRLHGAIFIFNFAAAISRLVKKSETAFVGAVEDSIICGRNLFWTLSERRTHAPTGRIPLIEFCSCLRLFVDIDRIPESVERKRLFQLI